MIKVDRAHLLDEHTVTRFNQTYLTFHSGTVWTTQPAYAFHGDAMVMGVKIIWDFMRGFSLNAAQRFNDIPLDKHKSAALHPILARLFALTLQLEKLFRQWADLTKKRYRYGFVDYFAIPGMLDLYHRNLRSNKTQEELLADHQKTLEYLEEVAQIIFIIALADTMPERLAQLPSPVWLNAWGVGLDPLRWKADKLFAPTTRPRALNIAQFAALFGIKEVLDYIM
jgi:hypothetical protein